MGKPIKPIFKYFAEIIVVAFGVFLGFYLTTLNSSKEHQKVKEQTLNLIIEELEINRKSTKEYVKFHENLKEQLNILDSLPPSYLNSSFYENNKRISKNIKGFKGFNYASQSNSAFETGKISGIFRDFDINIMQEIFSVYQTQELYTNFGNSILQKAVNLNSTSKIYDYASLLSILTIDELNIEKKLLTSQEELIEKLKHYQKESK